MSFKLNVIDREGNKTTIDIEEGTTISNLNDIGDVTISGIGSGEILKWNGSAWVSVTPEAGAKEGILHHSVQGQTCPRNYCYSDIKEEAIPERSKVITSIYNGIGGTSTSTGGLRTGLYDPHRGPLQCADDKGDKCTALEQDPKPKLFRIMTSECHQNFLRTCLKNLES